MSSIVKNVESSPESTCENKKMETSDESSERRQSLRQKKKRKFFMDEEYDSNRNTMNVDNIESKSDNLVTDKEIREMHSKKLAEVFQKYFFAKLDELQIPIEREKTRVTELLKSFNNSISLKEKIFVSKNLGFLVSSSDGTKTYNVNPKELKIVGFCSARVINSKSACGFASDIAKRVCACERASAFLSLFIP